jgi:thiamine biosynthesis lipoprotein
VIARRRATGRLRTAALLLLLHSACTPPPSPQADHAAAAAPHEPAVEMTRTGLTMGSQLTVTVLSSDRGGAGAAIDTVFAEFERLDGRLSVWRAESEVSQVNAAAGAHAVAVGSDLIAVLRTARQVSTWTSGRFDVTFAALSDVWRFDHDQDGRIPTPDEIAVRRPLIDYRRVEIDEPRQTVFLPVRGMRLHLGGIGKGYAVDRSAALLRARGFRDFLIQSGGDLYVSGRRQGRPWRLGIADPRRPADVFGTLDLSDGTLSTSGDYERAFVKDGVRYHHLLDPGTGQPARGCRSVTIVASNPVVADALSTGVFVLGAREGMALVERLPDVEAVIVSDTNEVLVSSGLRSAFRLVRPPGEGI